MENENLDEVQIEEVPGLELEIADTSKPEYNGIEGGEENIAIVQDDKGNYIKKPLEELEGNSEGDSNEDAPVEGNPVFNDFKSWAEQRGIDIDENQYDVENFNEDAAEKEVAKHYIKKYYPQLEENLLNVTEKGLDFNQYHQAAQQYDAIIGENELNLAKSDIFQRIYKHNVELGKVQPDQNGNITQQEMEMLQKATEEYAAEMGESALTNRGQQIKEYYQQLKEQLPEQMAQAQQQEIQKQAQKYEQDIDQALEYYKKDLAKKKQLLVPFSGESEKEEFISYMKDQMQLVENKGVYQSKMMQRLDDPDELAKVLRAMQLIDNGVFTDLKNKIRKETFEGLALTPTGKKNKTSKSSGGGLYIAPTWKKDYNK